MSIELFFSNHIELLSEKLSENLYSQRNNNILKPLRVIIPNQNLSKWIKIFLAKKDSVFMNIEWEYLESGLWKILLELNSGEFSATLFDNEKLKTVILYILLNLEKTETDFLPLIEYMGVEEKEGAKTNYAVKVWQLSEKLAGLFREYEFQRTDMILSWIDEIPLENRMEICQQKLYLKIKKLLSEHSKKTGKSFFSLMDFSREIFNKKNIIKKDIEDIHLFGFSQISKFHIDLIGNLKEYYNIFIYTLNPSREFWEDVKTPWEKKWIKRKKPDEDENSTFLKEDDNFLLSAWGKQGRENVRMLCELTDYEFNSYFFTEKKAENILHKIQNNITTFYSEKESAHDLCQDSSLQIFACPGIFREVETVYNSIIYNLSMDKNLGLLDIAVLVPDMSVYKPVFDSVFKKNSQSVSYNLIDTNAEKESIYSSAVLGILSLTDGRFSRKQIFELILNPCFMEKWELDYKEIQVFVKWADALNIFHGFDDKTKKAKGYSDTEKFTWKQGLKRLKMSKIMASPQESDINKKFGYFENIVPFSNIDTDDIVLMEKFCEIVETIYYCVTKIEKLETTCLAWKEIFFSVCRELIKIPEKQKGEKRVETALIKAFDNLSLFDDLSLTSCSKTINIEIIREFVRLNICSVTGGTGDYLVSGITVSGLLPMRPMPFKIIYILGLEEGKFPGKPETSSLDLRLSNKKRSDINIPERNSYLFLEILLSVREKLYISYIKRDLQKDRILQKSLIVNQLVHYINEEIFLNKKVFKEQEVPLKGSSLAYIKQDAVTHWSDVIINYSVSDRVSCFCTNNLYNKYSKFFSDKDHKKIEALNPDFSISDIEKNEILNPIDSKKNRQKIRIKQLKKFMEDPAVYGLYYNSGIRNSKESISNTILNEDEPFFSMFPFDYSIKKIVLTSWIDNELFFNNSLKLSDFLDKLYEDYKRKSITPEGVFSEHDKKRLEKEVVEIKDVVSPILEEMKKAKEIYGSVTLGEHTEQNIPRTDNLPKKSIPSLKLKIDTKDYTGRSMDIDVELSGDLFWIWKDCDNIWHVPVLTMSAKKQKEPDKYLFEPLLFYLACFAEKSFFEESAPEICFHMIYNRGITEIKFNLSGMDAENYLKKLLSDFLNEKEIFWMPFETIKKLSIKPYVLNKEENGEKKDNYFLEVLSAFHESEDIATVLAKPCVSEKIFDTVYDRFKIFFPIQNKKAT